MIHHKTNGGVGDTFYMWDFDRTDLGGFMLYVHRIFMHMIGYSSLKYFRAQNQHDKAEQLLNGVKTYIAIGVMMLALTRSISFLWWMYLEPLFCMTYFLALINVGFHGFLEYDKNGNHIPVINATTIVDDDDDFFGEDDHMAHHYHAGVYYRDLINHQKSKLDEYKKFHASVFRSISIVELSIYILFNLWDKIADVYVDYTDQLTRAEIIRMLKERAQRIEVSCEEYQEYLINPTDESKAKLRKVANGNFSSSSDNYIDFACKTVQ